MRITENIVFTLKRLEIEQTKVKFLGVLMEHNLTWKPHVQYSQKTVTQNFPAKETVWKCS